MRLWKHSAPPIVEKASGKTITTTISADRPLKGLRLYATCKQNTTTGAQLLDETKLSLGSGQTKYYYLEVGEGTFTLSSNCPTVSSIAILFFLAGKAESVSSSLNGVGNGITRTVTSVDGYVTVAMMGGRQEIQANPLDYNIMLNKGSTALPYEPYTGGKPSPSVNYPQEIQEISSMFDVNVSDGQGKSQTMTIPVQQQGFWGIPVSSGGNYTDADGQQWICDYIDFAEKKLVKNTAMIKNAGTGSWGVYSEGNGFYLYNALSENTTRAKGFCNCAYVASGASTQEAVWIGLESNALYFLNNPFYNSEDEATSLTKWKAHLAENPLIVITELKEPLEYNLSDEQIQLFENLRSYYPTTTITNNAEPDCFMEVEFVADTKLYIDSKLT